MRLDARDGMIPTLLRKPITRLFDIEDLSLLHEGQYECVGNTVVTASRAIPLLPRPLALNDRCISGAHQATHKGLHVFLAVQMYCNAFAEACMTKCLMLRV